MKKIKKFFKQIDWEKVLLNVLLTAIIPIIAFTAPVTSPATSPATSLAFRWDHWGISIAEKLQQGVLFSTIISIASNIVLSFRVKFRGLFSKKNQDNIEQGMKLLPFYSNLLIITSSFILMLLSAYYYGQIGGNAKLNFIGIIFEILLFIVIQILYGYSEGSMKEDNNSNLKELQQKAEEQQHVSEEKDINDLDSDDNEDFKTLRERKGGE